MNKYLCCCVFIVEDGDLLGKCKQGRRPCNDRNAECKGPLCDCKTDYLVIDGACTRKCPIFCFALFQRGEKKSVPFFTYNVLLREHFSRVCIDKAGTSFIQQIAWSEMCWVKVVTAIFRLVTAKSGHFLDPSTTEVPRGPCWKHGPTVTMVVKGLIWRVVICMHADIRESELHTGRGFCRLEGVRASECVKQTHLWVNWQPCYLVDF